MTKTLRVVNLCTILPLAVLPICFSIVSCGGKAEEDYVYAWVCTTAQTEPEGDQTDHDPTPYVWPVTYLRLLKNVDEPLIPIWYSSSFTDEGDNRYNRKWIISYSNDYPYTLDAIGFIYSYLIVESGGGSFWDRYYTFEAVR